MSDPEGPAAKDDITWNDFLQSLWKKLIEKGHLKTCKKFIGGLSCKICKKNVWNDSPQNLLKLSEMVILNF